MLILSFNLFIGNTFKPFFNICDCFYRSHDFTSPEAKSNREDNEDQLPNSSFENVKKVIDEYLAERKEIMSSVNTEKIAHLQKQVMNFFDMHWFLFETFFNHVNYILVDKCKVGTGKRERVP